MSTDALEAQYASIFRVDEKRQARNLCDSRWKTELRGNMFFQNTG
jgi:hypothetical protein